MPQDSRFLCSPKLQRKSHKSDGIINPETNKPTKSRQRANSKPQTQSQIKTNISNTNPELTPSRCHQDPLPSHHRSPARIQTFTLPYARDSHAPRYASPQVTPPSHHANDTKSTDVICRRLDGRGIPWLMGHFFICLI